MAEVKVVALLATGDEIINGDIVNSNTAYFAQQLKLSDIRPGKQLTVGDDKEAIKQAVLYLSQDHDAIITIGGLGPTEDDVTRFGLAEALQLPLEFNAEAWRDIETRFKQYRITITENNRLQALLPKNSQMIPNPNGSACACYLHHNNKDYFMLPGPPNECFPLFDSVVKPLLLKNGYSKKMWRHNWLLFNVSESAIATQLEKIDNPDCDLGYRVNYPYLEVKLSCENKTAFDTAIKKFDAILKSQCISNTVETASMQLVKKLSTAKNKLRICDNATGGYLQSVLLTPQTYHALTFCHDGVSDVAVNGLEDYWQQQAADYYQLQLKIHAKTETLTLPARGAKSLLYCCELVCLKLLNTIQQQ